MKNYTLDKKTEFILGYKVKNGKIHIKYANKKEGIVKYSEDKEEMILAKMEDQVLSSKTEKYKKNCLESGDKRVQTFVSLLLVTSVIAGASILVYLIPNLMIPIVLGIIGTNVGCAIYSYLPFNKITDIKKNKFFIDHKNEINEGIKENENDLTSILVNTKSKTRKLVSERKGRDIPFDINVIDSLSYSELVKLRDNIRRDKSFTKQEEEKVNEMVKK